MAALERYMTEDIWPEGGSWDIRSLPHFEEVVQGFVHSRSILAVWVILVFPSYLVSDGLLDVYYRLVVPPHVLPHRGRLFQMARSWAWAEYWYRCPLSQRLPPYQGEYVLSERFPLAPGGAPAAEVEARTSWAAAQEAE